jgi:hypothetical protein
MTLACFTALNDTGAATPTHISRMGSRALSATQQDLDWIVEV